MTFDFPRTWWWIRRWRGSITPGNPPEAGFMLPSERLRSQAEAARRHWRRFVSPLTRRILAVNVLALAFLGVGVLYLGRYQDRLIQADLEALKQVGEIFAGDLGEGAARSGDDELDELVPEQARQMVRRLVETTETRTRLYGRDGVLIADSRTLIGPHSVIQIDPLPPPAPPLSTWQRLGVRLHVVVNAFPSRRTFPRYHDFASDPKPDFPDIAGALTGEAKASVWSNAHNGLVLTVAVPVQRFKEVLGVVLLSRTGYDVSMAMHQVRLDILKVFAGALAVTVLLSVYLASTLARPIRRLAAAAERVRGGHGRQHEIPDFTRRNDEIGDLSGALRDMTEALWARLDAIERFAADVAHEIKNPLTSLRSAVETAARVTDRDQQRRLMDIIQHDVKRLDRLISDISNASRLDAELSRAETSPVDLSQLLKMLCESYAITAESQTRHENRSAMEGEGGETLATRLCPRVLCSINSDVDLVVPGIEGRLAQVFQNLISNALSFSPPGGSVTLSAHANPDDGMVDITIQDEGPGIPEGKLEAIFDRFYTERPAGESFGNHSGLGLSISKQIIEAHHGRIFAQNCRSESGTPHGAIFTVRLPRA